MKIERKWAMPNKWTFTILPIKKLLEEEMDGGFWIDPFAGWLNALLDYPGQLFFTALFYTVGMMSYRLFIRERMPSIFTTLFKRILKINQDNQDYGVGDE